jgi:hypothetical protein
MRSVMGGGWAGKPSTEEQFPARFIILAGYRREQMTKKIRLTKKVRVIRKNQNQFAKDKGHEKIGFDYYYPIPIFLEQIMDEIVEQSTKAGLDSYSLLKHFQFSDKEIEEYFDRLGNGCSLPAPSPSP